MKKTVSSTKIVPGRWLADERTYAAMQVSLPNTNTLLLVSVTALDAGIHPVCTLAVACEQGKLTLELIAAFRICQDDTEDAEEPDLAMYLQYIMGTAEFNRRVVKPFVAQMQACGMF